MAETRPLRMCDVCGGVDTDPRHVFAYADGDGTSDPAIAAKAIGAASTEEERAAILAQVADNSTTMRHMDCCREAGCPDGTCNEVTKGAESKTGAALVRHLTKGK